MFRYNREWQISRCEKNSGEYRIIAFSLREYFAYYFKNITAESTEYTVGYPTYTEYDAVTIGHGDFVTLQSTPDVIVD